MTKPFQRVLLHVGAPKTGTTSIQHFLFRNQPALQTCGFYVPSALSHGVQHIDLPLLFGSRPEHLERLAGARKGSIEEQREFATNAFATEIASASGADTLLVSSEHLLGSNPCAIAAYRRFFEPYAERFESLMYLRRQDRWIASSVLQRRKGSASADTRFRVAGSPRGFEQVIRNWDAGSDRCHIRRFDAEYLFGGSLLMDFCRVVGCDVAGLHMEDVYNRALLQEQFELVDALNGALAAIPFDKQTAYRSRFLPLCTAVLGGTPFEFARATAKAAFESYAPVNTWLRETRDPDGPAFFFDDDFSSYPMEPHNDRAYTTEQLFEFSAVIAERLRGHALEAPTRSGGFAREAIVSHIVSSFITLHEIEVEQERAARRFAAIEERRAARARLPGLTVAGAPAPDG